MKQMELRKYFRDTYVPETGAIDYEVVTMVFVTDIAAELLVTPEDTPSEHYHWVCTSEQYHRLDRWRPDPIGIRQQDIIDY